MLISVGENTCAQEELAAVASAAAMSIALASAAIAAPACEPDKLAEKYTSLAGKTNKIGGDPQTPAFVMRDSADFNKITVRRGLRQGGDGLPRHQVRMVPGRWSASFRRWSRARRTYSGTTSTTRQSAPSRSITSSTCRRHRRPDAGEQHKNIQGFDDFCGNRIAVGVGTVEEPQVRKQDEKCKAEARPASRS